MDVPVLKSLNNDIHNVHPHTKPLVVLFDNADQIKKLRLVATLNVLKSNLNIVCFVPQLKLIQSLRPLPHKAKYWLELQA